MNNNNNNEDVYAKVLLVAKDKLRQKHYLEVLNEYGAVCRTAGSFQEAITIASEQPHCGILVDMQLMLKIPSSKKVDVEDLLGALPSVSLNIHGTSGDVRVLPRGAKASGCTSLEHFIYRCKQSDPRIIFPKRREPVHYNVTLDTCPKLSTPYKTVCIDLSIGGCFIFCVRDDITVGSTVWIKIPDTLYESPLKAKVCWIREWGTSHEIPGIGLCFETSETP